MNLHQTRVVRLPVCAGTVTGQGAGVAAAVSVRLNQTVHNVDIRQVQSELERQGVVLLPTAPTIKSNL